MNHTLKYLILILVATISGSYSYAKQSTKIDEITLKSNNGIIRLSNDKGRLQTSVGISSASESNEPFHFYIFTNKGIAFESGLMNKGDKPKSIDIDLEGITQLYFATETASGNLTFNPEHWKNIQLTGTAAIANTSGDDEEQRYILTPPPPLSPRINGAKVIGATPGKPFLFPVATSGKRPIKFQANGLPQGLNLDENTGIISGTCNQPGTYNVEIKATNSEGTYKETIEIDLNGNLALTPHMGWNSWYIYGPYVTQDIMEKSAKAMHDIGLINFGYNFVNIDDGWQINVRSGNPEVDGPPRNSDGTIRPNENFPDMKKLADYIHNFGLKAGLYSSPGKLTCGGYAGSFNHEAIDIDTYNEWGFDFLKYDWCSYEYEVPNPTLADYQKPYEYIGKLCKEGKRDIILNMCQYGLGEVWKWGKEVGGQSWRTTGDIGDTNNLLNSMFRIGFFQEELREYAGPGGWNDPDYLLFGNIYDFQNRAQRPSPYTPSEHYTCMTLWCMMSAPLIFSGDITNLDDFTKNVLCNAEVIDINQDRMGKPGYKIFRKAGIEIWKKELFDGNTAIAIFNKRPIDSKTDINWKELGYDDKSTVRDLWRQHDMGNTGNNSSFNIPRHGCMLLKISNFDIK